MRNPARIRYLSLWHVDPTKTGHEQELFFKLKNLLLIASRYFDLELDPELYLFYDRRSVLNALDIMAPAFGMKAVLVGERRMRSFSAQGPLLARYAKELVLLLPSGHKNYRVYGNARKYPEFIARSEVLERFSEVIELFLAETALEEINAQTFNSRIRSFLPSALIFCASLLKIALLGASLLATSSFLQERGWYNIVALAEASLISLVAAIILDIFIARITVKNMQIIKLWSLALLYKRAFSLSLSEYVHTSYGYILALRNALAHGISRYFLHAPVLLSAWAFLILNIFGLMFLSIGAAFFLALLTLVATALGRFSESFKLKLEEEESKAITKNAEALQSVEASFAMATSLHALEPLLKCLNKAAEELARIRTIKARFKGYFWNASWLLPLWFMTFVVIFPPVPLSSNIGIGLLIILDAMLLGGALMQLIWPQRGHKPLDTLWIKELNDLHISHGHRIEAIALVGRIELNNVSFAYPDNGMLVFKNLSLTLNARSFYGITGPSGSGKTTLLRLLMGQVEAEQGQVIFDGQDLKSLKLNSLRQHFGVVGQGSSLFAGSIIDNILCGRQLPQSALTHLLYSHVVYDLLLDMPMGLQTFVFATGQNLSRVQIMLILLARALIHNPKILFMDEIFKGMPFNEQVLLKEYLKSLNMTRILVSHHPLEDVGCDKVFDLKMHPPSDEDNVLRTETTNIYSG